MITSSPTDIIQNKICVLLLMKFASMPDERRSHGLVSVVVKGLGVGPIAGRPLGNCEGLDD